MPPPPATAKAALRQTIRARLQAITPAQRSAASAQICTQLQATHRWHELQTVLFFVPLPDEPDLWPLLKLALQENKIVTLPSYDAEQKKYRARRIIAPQTDLQPGNFGVPEPGAHCPELPLNQLDLVLVPGVAFDPDGRRLGRGKGFYDRLLASIRGATCGVAYDEQIVAAVPIEPHDVRLNYILTPTRWHTASPARF